MEKLFNYAKQWHVGQKETRHWPTKEFPHQHRNEVGTRPATGKEYEGVL